MKITNKKLKTIGMLVQGLGIIISFLFKEIQTYIIIGAIILGMIIMMPWVNEKKSESK